MSLQNKIMNSKGKLEARELIRKERVEPALTRLPFWATILKKGHRPDPGVRKFVPQELEAFRQLGVNVYCSTIRSSGITDYRHCPRKFFYRYRLGLKPKTTTPALTIGIIYHLIVASLYRHGDVQKALALAAQKGRDMEKELQELAANNPLGILPNGKAVEEQIEGNLKALQKAKTMALWAWENHPFNLDKWEVWDVEKLIEINFISIVAPIRARVDLILKEKGTNNLYIVDHKTTNAPCMEYFATVTRRLQTRLYRLAVETMLYNQHKDSGLKVVGMIYDVIRKPAISFSSQDDLITAHSSQIAKKIEKARGDHGKAFTAMTDIQKGAYRKRQKEIDRDSKFSSRWEKHLWRVKTWYDDATKESPSEPPFMRGRFRFNSPVVTEELFLQLREASRACRANPDPARYYRDPSCTACNLFGSKCVYTPLCNSTLEGWPEIIEANYETKTRDQEDLEQEE